MPFGRLKDRLLVCATFTIASFPHVIYVFGCISGIEFCMRKSKETSGLSCLLTQVLKMCHLTKLFSRVVLYL